MQFQRPFDPVVTFRNSQGEAARGTLTSLQRRSLVMEVYNPYSIVQVSEVLSELSIRSGERSIYKGKAVVVSLLSTMPPTAPKRDEGLLRIKRWIERVLAGEIELGAFFGKITGCIFADAEFRQRGGIAPAGQSVLCLQPEQAAATLVECSLAGLPRSN